MWRHLNRAQRICGKHQVRRLRRELGLEVKWVWRFRTTSACRHSDPVAPDRLAQQFTVAAPNWIWSGDITFPRISDFLGNRTARIQGDL